MTKRKTWVYAPPRPKKFKIPELVKASIGGLAESFIQRVLNPKFIEPPPENDDLNYVTGVSMKWHQSALYFVKELATPGPNAISPTFKRPFARMTYSGKDVFDLAYQRHTGQWVTLFRGFTLEECFETIAEKPFFL